MVRKTQQLNLSPTHIIMLGFLFIIFLGSVLLALPISSANGEAVPYIDALFTATTSTCVTGLVTLPVISTWSTFGHIVILVLIQIGGLGVVTVMAGIMIVLHKKISMKDRVLLQDSFNLNSLSGVVQFTKKVIGGTLLIETIGAVLYMIVFVPQFGPKGIWISIFNSVSAFCNAGIDIVSETSLCPYALNPMINLTSNILIIMGGIGFVVWWDVARVVQNIRTQKLKCFRSLTLHTKITLCTTAALLIIGTVAVFAFEYNNPLTIGRFSTFEKLEVSFFQSVTTRTAGFATIPQENLTNSSVIMCLLLMFIGGSPVGTAGGIKTVTFTVLIASTLSTVRNKNDVTMFNRKLTKQVISKAVAVTGMSFLITFISTLLLSAVTDANALDMIYETVSATATVGLSRNLTSTLNHFGKLIIIVTMYLGRVSPISFAIAFKIRKQTPDIIKNPTETISVG